jgi:predicted O-methyltransferase YrrM
MKTIINDITSREAFMAGSETLEKGYPWLTFGSLMTLEYIITKDFKVLEFGSGGSTVFWARNCASVKSFETKPEWFESVKKRTEEFTNVELTLGTEQEILEAIKKETDNTYDLVLVDNEPRHTQRLLLANAAVPKIKSGGWIIIDNYLRFGMSQFKYPSKIVYTFDEIGYRGMGTRLCKIIQ